MAERRMFTQKIVDSDAFLDMPLSTQALYFHLNMRADDDGFVNNPKKIQRMVGASEDDLRLLLAKRFILGFESGIVVIKHWRMHNLLRKDRYNPTQYVEEMASLALNDNGSYTENHLDNRLATTRQPLDNLMATQDRLGEDSIVQDSIGEGIVSASDEPKKAKRKRFAPPTLDEVKAYCQERKNGIDAQKFIDYYTANGWKVGRTKMEDWQAAVRTWERNQYGNKGQTESNSGSDLDDFWDAAVKKTYEDFDKAQKGGKSGRAALDRGVIARMEGNAGKEAKTASNDAELERRAAALREKIAN